VTSPEVLTAEQLAELLQLDAKTVRALAARGEIPGRKLGREWRFSRSAVLDWLGAG
jgi:excisionase family DNA binding protein